MPYNAQNKWVPPAAAEACGRFEDDTSDEQVLQTLMPVPCLHLRFSIHDVQLWRGV